MLHANAVMTSKDSLCLVDVITVCYEYWHSGVHWLLSCQGRGSWGAGGGTRKTPAGLYEMHQLYDAGDRGFMRYDMDVLKHILTVLVPYKLSSTVIGNVHDLVFFF